MNFEIKQTDKEFYQEYLHRKLKFGSYIRRGISEQKMLARFKKTFGTPEEVVIGFGDFVVCIQVRWMI